MYTTRPLSTLRNSHCELQSEEPFSGSLFLDDKSELSILSSSCCWGKHEKKLLKNLPFPQDRIITIKYSQQQGGEKIKGANKATVFFVPVLNQPSSVSFNRYHVIIAKGRNKGKAYVCSKESIGVCCSCRGERDVKPRTFDHRDVHQQMEIVCEKEGLFTAKSVAHDGQPPWLLRSKYWKAYVKPKSCHLSEALGLNQPLRSCLPSINFPIHARDCPKVTIGKWYCPFVFVKEDGGLDGRMKRALYYAMTLEQFRKEIYTCENNNSGENAVEVNTLVESKAFFVDGKEVGQDKKRRCDGFIWFAPFESKPKGVGLSLAIWERLIWEQKKEGWIDDDEDEEVGRIVREFEGENNMWRRFACYILVERYVLKRMDGSLALTFDFRHVIKLRTKWE